MALSAIMLTAPRGNLAKLLPRCVLMVLFASSLHSTIKGSMAGSTDSAHALMPLLNALINVLLSISNSSMHASIGIVDKNFSRVDILYCMPLRLVILYLDHAVGHCLVCKGIV